jgi:acetoin utilization deacetylase AcuC-like enzyme
MAIDDPTILSAHERETSLIVFDNPQFDEHDPGWGHPECPERLPAIRRALAPHHWPVRPGRPATLEELSRAHTEPYIDRIMAVQGQSTRLDPDTGVSPGSVDAALLAAGAAVEAADLAVAGRNCFVTCRPPGHHATANRAMGFCLFNNAAVAAAHLAAQGYRVAVIDPDAHHGNGTQDIFYHSPEVLYVSWHRSPFYPGSGAAEEYGAGAGAGFTLNIPLPMGADDGLYLGALRRLVLPAVERFQPDAVVFSAGFDQMEGDLLGGMELSREGLAVLFRAFTSRWPCMAVLEGGYNTRRLGGDVEVAARMLAGEPAPDVALRIRQDWVEIFDRWHHPLLEA